MEITFKKWKCEIKTAKYMNGNNAIQFIEAGTGEPILTASVNPPHIILADDEIAIKDYSENEGVAECLKYHEIIGTQVSNIVSGWVNIPVYKLTEKGKALFMK